MWYWSIYSGISYCPLFCSSTQINTVHPLIQYFQIQHVSSKHGAKPLLSSPRCGIATSHSNTTSRQYDYDSNDQKNEAIHRFTDRQAVYLEATLSPPLCIISCCSYLESHRNRCLLTDRALPRHTMCDGFGIPASLFYVSNVHDFRWLVHQLGCTLEMGKSEAGIPLKRICN
jgi:hypothetical protein